jgi:hypothetical protein
VIDANGISMSTTWIPQTCAIAEDIGGEPMIDGTTF